jgi:hypothetical protein
MTPGKSSPGGRHRRADTLPLQPAGFGSPRPSHDRLRSAGWLLGLAAGIVLLCILTVIFDKARAIASRPATAESILRAAGLSEPVLVPAGHPARRPDLASTSIDGRYLPTLPRGNPEVIPLLDAEILTARRAMAP